MFRHSNARGIFYLNKLFSARWNLAKLYQPECVRTRFPVGFINQPDDNAFRLIAIAVK
jgi:hypothetical protein